MYFCCVAWNGYSKKKNWFFLNILRNATELFQVAVITVPVDMRPSCSTMHVKVSYTSYCLVDGISNSTKTSGKPTIV